MRRSAIIAGSVAAAASAVGIWLLLRRRSGEVSGGAAAQTMLYNEYADQQWSDESPSPEDQTGEEGTMVIGGQEVVTGFPVRMRSGLRVTPRSQQPTVIVIHHSVTASANSTYNVLKQRNLSTHFEVDQDGSVWQYADPAADEATHATKSNRYSIGIDLTGPVGEAGFPEVQMDTLAALVKFLADWFGIPLTTEPWGTAVAPGTPGVYAHAQVQANKIDPSWPYGSAGVWEKIQAGLG